MSRATLRVVLAPRAGADARRLLGEAAALAQALDAELAALFVEESDVLSAVSLPFSVEIGLVSGAIRPADPESIRRQLARHAEQLRALVAQTASGLGVRWSFDVTRGDLVAEALAAAAAAPVLLAPPRSAVQRVTGQPPARRGRAMVAALEVPTAGEASGDRAWAAAVRFAGDEPDAVVRVRLEDLLRGPAPRLLVVSLASVADHPGLLDRVLASARCPVVLVA